MYKYLRNIWAKKSPEFYEILKNRLIEWRKEPATVRIERPTRLDRARSIGYRAKPGFVVVRQRVLRGGRLKPQIRAGRRPKHMGRKKVLNMSYQYVAEQRAVSKFPNLEVLNSYYLAKDGRHYWYEIIMVDRNHPAIKSDEKIAWITSDKNKRRVFRGLTHAARSSQMRR